VTVSRLLLYACAPLSAVVLGACASTVSTSAFKGGEQTVAQTVANLQTDATASEPKKICADDLAASVVSRLGGSAHCEAAIKTQLAEIDSMEVSVKSIHIAADQTSATAEVKSIHEGKGKLQKLSLVKEAGKWKISGL
jgi:copper chaperone CopZ